MTNDPDHEPHHAVSPTCHILEELALYGHRLFDDEPDARPLPEAHLITGAIIDIFDALVVTLQDNRLEPDLETLLWGQVNLFHRTVDRIERELNDNEQAQKRAQREQGASAMIDSRDFLAARRRAETEVMLPAGPKIAFTGRADLTDHRLIWDTLDKVAAKHPGMVLMHGGSPKGAELIASRWADSRKVEQIAFKRDWPKHAKAAPFKRNDAMLDILPIGVIVFAGTGIQDNLADKARKLGIPLFDFRPNQAVGNRMSISSNETMPTAITRFGLVEPLFELTIVTRRHEQSKNNCNKFHEHRTSQTRRDSRHEYTLHLLRLHQNRCRSLPDNAGRC